MHKCIYIQENVYTPKFRATTHKSKSTCPSAKKKKSNDIDEATKDDRDSERVKG